MPNLPTPHLEKLTATLENEKLPAADRPRVEEAIRQYETWVRSMTSVNGTEGERLRRLVSALDDYKRYIDVDLIFDSPEDFLYRQKGQLKIDNSIIEEFLPHLVQRCVLDTKDNLGGVHLGPRNAFSAVYFESTLGELRDGGGLHVRTKDQDFAISREMFLSASHDAQFTHAATTTFHIAYVAAECKTNLDKTMFQEACATARDTKSAVPGAKYFLVVEWLDMTPQSTAPTDIDEVLILRKTRRIPANKRSSFSSVVGRRASRDQFVEFLSTNPFQPDVFGRLLQHIEGLLSDDAPVEVDVLKNGYF